MSQAAPAKHGGLGGFLAHLTADDPDGITFRDKLMALGSIVGGNGGEAQTYLQSRRAEAAKQKALDQAKDMKRKQAQAFFGAMRPDGSLDLAKYAQLAGDAFDAGDASKIYKDLAPSYEFVTPGPGGVFMGNKATGKGSEVVPPRPTKPEKDPPGISHDAAGTRVLDKLSIEGQKQIYGGRAEEAARYRAAPPWPSARNG